MEPLEAADCEVYPEAVHMPDGAEVAGGDA